MNKKLLSLALAFCVGFSVPAFSMITAATVKKPFFTPKVILGSTATLGLIAGSGYLHCRINNKKLIDIIKPTTKTLFYGSLIAAPTLATCVFVVKPTINYVFKMVNKIAKKVDSVVGTVNNVQQKVKSWKQMFNPKYWFGFGKKKKAAKKKVEQKKTEDEGDGFEELLVSQYTVGEKEVEKVVKKLNENHFEKPILESSVLVDGYGSIGRNARESLKESYILKNHSLMKIIVEDSGVANALAEIKNNHFEKLVMEQSVLVEKHDNFGKNFGNRYENYLSKPVTPKAQGGDNQWMDIDGELNGSVMLLSFSE